MPPFFFFSIRIFGIMNTRRYQGIISKKGLKDYVEDELTIEEALSISINDSPFTITMRTPGDDDCLVRGILNSEGIVRRSTEISCDFSKEEGITIANISIKLDQIIKDYTNNRNLLSVSSCGICGTTELEDLSSEDAVQFDGKSIPSSIIPTLFDQMEKEQSTFHRSGGSHAAGLFSLPGTLLSLKEDIGRHNAVDKVIGDLINQKRLNEANILTVSGRVSYEIIIKAFKGRIPVVCSVSAPSSLAVDFAKELGITLIAFCRDDRFTCYSKPERVDFLR